MERLFLSIGLVLCLLTFAHSQSYKYRDPQGRLVITNDLNKVPPDQRPGPKERNPPAAQVDSNQPATATFEGRVVKVLDGQTLQVLRQGKPVSVRVRDLPTHVSMDRIRELVGQQTVTVIIYGHTPDGTFVGEVILPTGHSLSQEVAPADVAAKYDKPLVPIVVPSPLESTDIDPRTQCDEVMKGKTKSDRSYQPIYSPCCNNPSAMKSKEAMGKCIGQRGAEEMLKHGLLGRVPASPAQQPAQVSQDKIDFCQAFARVVHVVAMLRDKGMSMSEMLAGVRKNPPDSPRHVLAVNEDVVRSIYAKPDTNPATIALRSFTECVSN